MRSSKDDSDANSPISHAAEIAKQFDVKLRVGALFDSITASQAPPPEFPSALSLLSGNTFFVKAWASSELRLMGTQVGGRLEKILALESSSFFWGNISCFSHSKRETKETDALPAKRGS